MAGINDISRGRADYNAPIRPQTYNLFNDIVATNNPPTPDAAIPAMRQGYMIPVANNGQLAPPVIQSSPWAGYAYRTLQGPWGGLGVQPLIGFNSPYPHVLNGVPNSFMDWMPFFSQFMVNPYMMGMMAGQQRQAQPAKSAGTGNGGNAPAKNSTPSNPAPAPAMAPPQQEPAFALQYPLPWYEPQPYQPAPPAQVIPQLATPAPIPDDYSIPRPYVDDGTYAFAQDVGLWDNYISPAARAVWDWLGANSPNRE